MHGTDARQLGSLHKDANSSGRLEFLARFQRSDQTASI
jgi:hypothetical protein